MTEGSKKIFVTKDGLQNLKNEYKELTEVRRPEITERIEKARRLGDISENAEYTTAKEDQSFVEGRVSELEEILKNAQIIKNEVSETVKVGSKVKVHIEGSEEEFHIVGALEADPDKKKISDESPLGTSLLGRRVGDSITVTVPIGKVTYRILEIF